MKVYHTEEEQLAAIKAFWQDYGKTIIASIVVVLAVTFGWQYYQAKQNSHIQAGAVEYHKLLEMMDEPDASLDSLQKQAQVLKDHYAKTPYAAAGALLIARKAVDDKNLPEAKAQLEWINFNSKEGTFTELAHIRLARILLSEKDFAEALKELDNHKAGAFEGEYQEARGDILYAMQKPAEARAAYEAALKVLPSSPEKMLIQMKFDDLASSNDVLWTPSVQEKAQ